jgi:micrococcal nuclease
LCHIYLIEFCLIKGKVVSIAYGDAITVLQNSKQYKIRLYGIDTPEKKQDFGQKAKLFTSNMVFNKKVKVIPIDVDRYKRIVGMVYVDEKCLNEELVKAGYAWIYKKYCKKSFCDEWLKLEQAAREDKIGLWVDSTPTGSY